jgi:Kef-type K+ transport system membrane component KefB
MRALPGWAATLISIATTLVVFALLIGAVNLVAWFLLDWRTTGANVRTVLVWSSICAVIAFTIGGWLAARLRRIDQKGSAAAVGALVGLGALLVIILSVKIALGEQMDFHSVAVALGYTEVRPATEQLPFPITTTPPDAQTRVDENELARTRALTTMAYLVILGLSGLSAGATGGSLGVTPRHTRS